MDWGGAGQFSWACRGISPRHPCHKGTISGNRMKCTTVPCHAGHVRHLPVFWVIFICFFRLNGCGKHSFFNTNDNFQGNLTILTLNIDFSKSPWGWLIYRKQDCFSEPSIICLFPKGFSQFQKARLFFRVPKYFSAFPPGGVLQFSESRNSFLEPKTIPFYSEQA